MGLIDHLGLWILYCWVYECVIDSPYADLRKLGV
jgi:hypothetical protein